MLYMVAKHFIKHLRGTKVNREEHYVPISFLWFFHRQPAQQPSVEHSWEQQAAPRAAPRLARGKRDWRRSISLPLW